MTSHVVEGVRLPDAVAHHRALELCNTKAAWGEPGEHEYLTDFTALTLWTREHAFATPAEVRVLRAQPTAVQCRSLRDVRALRATLYSVVTSPGGPAEPADAPDATDVLEGFVRRAVARSSYEWTKGRLQLQPPVSPTVLVDRLALEAHRLLEQYGPASVGRCSGSGCGWVFLDPTHRRRWCVMAICGNRAKARRFAERQRVRT